jgi:membrane-associated phospholipid phosphatase
MIETRLETVHLERPLDTLLHKVQTWDERIIRRVVNSRPQNSEHPINRVMRALTRAGDADTWTLIVVGLFISGGAYREAVITRVPALLLTLLVTHILKRIFRRRRPSVKMPDLSRLLGNPDAFSFPSSHTACAWAICMGMSLHFPVASAFLIPLAAGISWSRIHVGAHYLSDILVGASIGVTLSWIVHTILAL